MLVYPLFILGFVLLIKGASWLVDGASSIAKKLKISDLVIGLTIVAFGTSAPELFVNLFAAWNGSTDIAIGNIIGSNIVNMFFILGLAAIIYPLKVSKGTVWKEIPLSLLAALLILVMANDALIDGLTFNELTRSDGLVLISFFIIFLYYTFGIAKDETSTEIGAKDIAKQYSTSNYETLFQLVFFRASPNPTPGKTQDFNEFRNSRYSTLKSVGLILTGLIGLVLGGQWIINGATQIASSLGLSDALIGLTIIAIGTSLPELATSLVAAYKRNVDIAVGNVVGSNIFNIFWILGISAIIKPLPFKLEMNLDLVVASLASIFLFIWMFLGKRHTLERWQGIVFVLIYIIYMGIIIARG